MEEDTFQGVPFVDSNLSFFGEATKHLHDGSSVGQRILLKQFEKYLVCLIVSLILAGRGEKGGGRGERGNYQVHVLLEQINYLLGSNIVVVLKYEFIRRSDFCKTLS